MPLPFPFRRTSSASLVIRFFSLAASLLPSPCLAQFPKASQSNLTTIKSPINPSITVTYKVPDGACATVFEAQQQYTGWVNVPGEFETNLFFWFVAARQQSSVLTIWLNGGPGSSSMFGFFSENGPCQVVEQGADGLGTVPRAWGWDRASNMLFIDQVSQWHSRSLSNHPFADHFGFAAQPSWFRVRRTHEWIGRPYDWRYGTDARAVTERPPSRNLSQRNI